MEDRESPSGSNSSTTPTPRSTPPPIPSNPSLHSLLLLSDSALPLGSFAFSSGLESFLAHHPNPSGSQHSAFDTFLTQSLHNIASTSLPYVLTAHAHPAQLPDLDNDIDASTLCTVARRASISQGRAMLGIWERALSLSGGASTERMAAEEIARFARRVREDGSDAWGLRVRAHFAPLFGAVCKAVRLSASETAYVFLLGHAKAVLSAAVRASVMGPYQSHAVLANVKLQETMAWCVERFAGVAHANAGVTVPTMDLWLGRHELLYSRIFNS